MKEILKQINKISETLFTVFKPSQLVLLFIPFMVLKRLDNKGFNNILVDEHNIENNLNSYIESRNDEIKDILDKLHFTDTIKKLNKNNFLYTIIQSFAYMNLDYNKVSNIDMGNIFEELINSFSEMTNETAGEHYTPRSIVQLCAELIIGLDVINDKTPLKTIYDPTCGTAGMLLVADDVLKRNYPNIVTQLYGQELNEESYAIAKADLMLKGYNSNFIKLGNTLTEDKHNGKKFSYVLANPPYGVSWKHQEKYVKEEAEKLGFNGRFGAGTPSVSDGSLLFVQHMISKLDEKGRCAVVLNGSPLTNGDAGSGESNIRKWILDNDLLVAIIALPTDMFYNTGIKTYIWVLDRTKEERRKGKVQFIDASGQFFKMKKALGNKRNDMSQEQVDWVKKQYEAFDKADSTFSKVVTNEDLMFRKVTVDVAEIDDKGNTIKDKKNNPVIDKSQRDTEKVPFAEDIAEYMKREVLPHVPNAIWDEGKIGAEFPLDQYFYKYEPLPSTEYIETELNASVSKIQNLMKEIFG